jgi:site-specific recombinase XerD
MTRQSVDLFFKKMQKDLGFKIHAHKFRHTFAVKAILSGVPINILQKWLSHSSIFITSIYTDITGMDTSQFMNQMQ